MTRHLVATILLDSVDGQYATTIAFGGKLIRIAPTQTLGTQMLLVAGAVLEERERTARAALPDCVDGEEHS